MTNYYDTFIKKLTDLSVSKEWTTLIEEWVLEGRDYYLTGHCEYCLCGHQIENLFILENKYNQNCITVGSCCIRKFNPILEEVEMSMQKIHENPSKTVSKRTLEFAYKNGFINKNLYEAYKNIRYKRERMSEKMLKYKKDINHKMYVQYKVYKYTNNKIKTDSDRWGHLVSGKFKDDN